MRWNRRNLLGALGAASVVPYFGCSSCMGSESKRGVLIGEPTANESLTASLKKVGMRLMH